MANAEWWQVEDEAGRPIGAGATTAFENEEAGNAAARDLAPNRPDSCLTLVRYSRTEIRTFTKQVTIAEADVPPPA